MRLLQNLVAMIKIWRPGDIKFKCQCNVDQKNWNNRQNRFWCKNYDFILNFYNKKSSLIQRQKLSKLVKSSPTGKIKLFLETRNTKIDTTMMSKPVLIWRKGSNFVNEAKKLSALILLEKKVVQQTKTEILFLHQWQKLPK